MSDSERSAWSWFAEAYLVEVLLFLVVIGYAPVAATLLVTGLAVLRYGYVRRLVIAELLPEETDTAERKWLLSPHRVVLGMAAGTTLLALVWPYLNSSGRSGPYVETLAMLCLCVYGWSIFRICVLRTSTETAQRLLADLQMSHHIDRFLAFARKQRKSGAPPPKDDA